MATLGETLSAERRRLGKSIVEVEASTRIRGRMIEYLEHGDFDSLPSPAYVKGYIQSYAKFLGLDAGPLLDLYKAETRQNEDRAEQLAARPSMPRGASYSKASRQNLEDLPAEQVVPKREHQHSIPMRTWAVIAIVLVLAGGIIWGLSRLLATPEIPQGVPRAGSASAATSTTATESPVETASPSSTQASGSAGTSASPVATSGPSAETTPNKAAMFLTFRIRPGETSTLKVTVDGVAGFDGTISDTSKPQEMKFYSEATIVIGKPIWVTTFRDGKRIPTPNETTAYTLNLTNDNPTQ